MDIVESPPSKEKTILLDRLQKARSSLLDLTMRNPLISFNEKGAKVIPIIDELPDQVYALLSGEGEGDSPSMFLDPLISEEPSQFLLTESSGEITQKAKPVLKILPDPNSGDYESLPQHGDNRLQTSLGEKTYKGRLQKITADYSDYLHTTGSNFLYLAIGFLKWYQSKDDGKPRYSPIILLPLEISKIKEPVTLVDPKSGEKIETAQYVYKVNWSGEEIQTNQTFRQFILQAQDAPGIEFPVFDGSPEKHFSALTTLLASLRFPDTQKWSVERKMGITFFASSKEIMYRDLDPENWSGGEDLLSNYGVLSSLGITPKEGTRNGLGAFDPEDTDHFYSTPIHTIVPADSSQMASINRVLRGDSIVIQGPPGTGKSQTITNLIGAAMAEGKSILFMAEKLEALNVVYSRLTQEGLGAFCLELHSNRTTGKHFAAQLKLRDEATASPPDITLSNLLGSLEESSETLRATGNDLLQKCEISGFSVFEVLWKKESSLQQLEACFLRCAVELPTESIIFPEIDHRALSQAKTYLEPIRRAWDDGILETSKLWNGFLPQRIIGETDIGNLSQIFQSGRSALNEINKISNHANLELGLRITKLGESSRLNQLATVIGSPPNNLSDTILLANFEKHDSPFKTDQIANLGKQILKLSGTPSLTYLQFDNGNITAEQFGEAATRAHETANKFATFSDFEARYELLLSEMTSLRDLRSTAQEAADFVGITNTIDTLEQVKTLGSLLSLLSDLTPSACSAMHHQHFAVERTNRKLCEARSYSETLTSGNESLRKHLEIDRMPPESECLELAIDLKALASSFLKFRLFGRLRTAKKKGQSLAKQPGHVLSSEWLQSLEKHIQFLKESKIFKEDQDYQHLLGDGFIGNETRWEHIENSLQVAESLLDFDNGDDRTAREEIFNRVKTQSFDEVKAHQLREKLDAMELRCPYLTDYHASESLSEIHESFSTSEIQYRKTLNLLSRFATGSEVPLTEIARDLEKAKQSVAIRKDLCEKCAPLGDAWGNSIQTLIIDHISALQECCEFACNTRKQCEENDFLRLYEVIFSGASTEKINAIKSIGNELTPHLNHLVSSRDNLAKLATIREGAAWSSSPKEDTLNSLSMLWNPGAEEFSLLKLWSEYSVSLKQLEDIGALEIVAFCQQHGIDGSGLEPVRSHLYWSKLATIHGSAPSPLASFHRNTTESVIQRFSIADKSLPSAFRSEVQKKVIACSVGAPKGVSKGRVTDKTERALFDHYKTKVKAPPVRDFVTRAPLTLKAMFPCWMLSPSSVAKFLPPQMVDFDLLILDEASQIRPEDALGSMARAKQIVVVGDSQQMPPSNAFKNVRRSNSEDLEDDAEDETTIDSSVLDAMQPRLPNVTLSWHYRSLDENLIAFSNLNFYEEKLFIPPKANRSEQATGIFHTHLEGMALG